MQEERFWQIIDHSSHRWEWLASWRLRRALGALTPDEIIGFERQFERHKQRAHKGDVWAAGVLVNCGHGSDDGFEYFRNWLIGQGRERYSSTLSTPDSLADLNVKISRDGPIAEWETFASSAHIVYSKATGRNLFDDVSSAPSAQSLPEENEFDWQAYNDAWMAKNLPRLWSRYGVSKQVFDAMVDEADEH